MSGRIIQLVKQFLSIMKHKSSELCSHLDPIKTHVIRVFVSTGSLPAQSQKMYSSQPELKTNWTKVSFKRGRSTQEETEREVKHTKEKEHCINQTCISNHCTALLEEESEDQQQKAGPEHMPKPPPIYITDIKNISPLIQLFLEQITKQQYEIKAAADNQVKVQPKTSESYKTIIKSLAKKHVEFHIYKLKEERSYRVVLKTYPE
jgi:hypothetical protein